MSKQRALPNAFAVCRDLCAHLENQGYKNVALQICNSYTSDEDRVGFCLSLLETNDVISLKEIKPPDEWLKSYTRALALKSDGNVAFKAKDYIKALVLYTESIALAPSTSTEDDPETRCLSVAFANRSAVLWHLKKYRECIKDIDNALHVGYPWDLLSKLYVRRGKCEQLVGSLTQAEENFQMALKYVGMSSDINIDKEIQSLLLQINTVAKQLANLSINKCQTMPPLKNGTSERIHSASKCVGMSYNVHMGRHLISTESIEPGDVLVIEKAHTSVLFQDFFHTHCYNCLKRSICLIPCVRCSKVMFCSVDCRNESWNNYHQIECKILPFLHQIKIGRNGLLSMKIVLKLFLSQDYSAVRRNINNETKLEEHLKGYTNEGTYISSHYNAIYWLVTNTEKKNFQELFENAVLAAYMVQILEAYTQFFSLVQIRSLINKGVQNIGNILGSLLLRHLHNLPCNAHSIMEMVKDDKSSNEICEEIGAGVYATLSLINHSCDPNVARFSYYGDTAVLRAIKPISAGEQILDNYGYHYSLMDKIERQRSLQCLYQFSCICQACLEDWPKYDDQPSCRPFYICNRCKAAITIQDAKCFKCEAKYNLVNIDLYIEESKKKLNMIIIKLNHGGRASEEEIQILIHYIKMLDLYVKRPWQDYSSCQETLKHCFAKMGNYFDIISLRKTEKLKF